MAEDAGSLQDEPGGVIERSARADGALVPPDGTGAHAAPVRDAPTEPVRETAADAPPRRRGNRLVASIWVLFAALVFQVLYVVLVAVLVAVLAGPAEVPTQMAGFVREPWITWVPVVVFVVLYELAVLVLGRAGRFVYVVASLVVGVLVWLLSTGAADLLETAGRLTGAQYAQTLIAPTSVIVGVLAREVMLWTGYAVGARGLRLRRRDRRDRAAAAARIRGAAG